MRLIFSPRSRRDLIAIGDYIAHDSSSRAYGFVGELRASCQALLLAPLAYPIVPELPGSVRRKVFGQYSIFYRTGQDAVEIVRVLHGAQDFVAALGRD